ncbi:DUF4175 domain-containing protein [Paraglaciecola sp. 20A4]|uniref:DUF4175 domain-containing protein n=1 Tax=Paraglaciecola sp. 20A4 TaxID=2687288 RepID=UPI00140E48D9|nr:DUF4175 domain-containing protein [Paraglaciecola sp. 20A4]
MAQKLMSRAQRLHTLKRALQKSKKRKLLQHMLQCSPFMFVLTSITYFAFNSGNSLWLSDSQCLILLGIASFIFGLGFMRPSYKKITLRNLAKHLNRRFTSLEESCELLLTEDDKEGTVTPSSETLLSSIKHLQYKRSAAAFDNLSQDRNVDLAVNYPLKVPLLLNLITAMMCLLGGYFIAENKHSNPTLVEKASLHESGSDENSHTDTLANILSAQLAVIAPEYTLGKAGYLAHQLQPLDAQVLAGSKVSWRFDFSISDAQYTLKFNADDSVKLVQTADGLFTASKVIQRACVYQVLDAKQRVIAVHTIGVTPDAPPKITYITPQATITEIQTADDASKPLINTQALISDDFGLSKIEIVASVAKGSGESVKFRDSVFSFDSVTDAISHKEGQRRYSKSWDLVELGMTPGDELYFSIRAWDNRQPEGQLTRSSSKIVRWLDKDVETVFSEGISVNNMPAYFKSQRQIIIDTKSLIEESGALSDAAFKHLSQDLGIAQADLKHKYGQFVGDEISGITRSMEDGGSKSNEEHNDHNDSGEEDAHEGHSDHEGQNAHEQQNINDKSGYQAMLEQFGHAHGETDIAIFKTKGSIEQNPRVMMKRAIGYMWQAESQLLLNRPHDALPHEEQALLWLNRAKKAERIYVKRLGFEPPPVSEKRRYQGELGDIKNKKHNIPTVENENEAQTLSLMLTLLNDPLRPALPFNENEIKVLQNTDALLQKRLINDPNAIHALALLAQIQSANKRYPPTCELCAQQLQEQLWQLLPAAKSSPLSPNRPYSNSQSTITHYAEFLRSKEQQ